MCVDLKEWYVCWFGRLLRVLIRKRQRKKNFEIRLNKAIIGHRISWCFSNMHKLKVITNSRTVALNAVTLLDIERKKKNELVFMITLNKTNNRDKWIQSRAR